MRMLVSIQRLLIFVAVLSLGVAGGFFAHDDLALHAHAANSHHTSTHDHLRTGGECCDINASEVVHCGANLLAVTSSTDLILPRSVSRHPAENNQVNYGINHSVDPPPPRFFLA